MVVPALPGDGEVLAPSDDRPPAESGAFIADAFLLESPLDEGGGGVLECSAARYLPANRRETHETNHA
jgi:hypothetical protein